MALVPWRRAPVFVFDDTWGNDDGVKWEPYFVLGVPPDPREVTESLSCPQRLAELHTAYLELSRNLHPDRLLGRSGPARRTNFPWIPLDEQYKAVTAAHKLLMDPYLRARYHLCKDIDNPELYAIMAAAKQSRAVHEVEHMQLQYEDIVAEQEAKAGLIVVRALYGETMDIKPSAPLAFQDVGEAIDVTVPVQILVQRTVSKKTGREVMKIELSDASKVHLDGFFDPVAGYPKQLVVRYKYRNHLHQVVVADKEKLRIPLARHLIPMEDEENAGLRGLEPKAATLSGAATVFGDVTNAEPSVKRRKSRGRSSLLPQHTHSVGRQCRRVSSGSATSTAPADHPPPKQKAPRRRTLRRRTVPVAASPPPEAAPEAAKPRGTGRRRWALLAAVALGIAYATNRKLPEAVFRRLKGALRGSSAAPATSAAQHP